MPPKVAVQEPITGLEAVGTGSTPEDALVQFYRAFNGRDLALMEQNWDGGDDVYTVGRERGRLAKGDTRLDLEIRTTRIYRRRNGAWRQVHHHGSIETPALLAAYQAAVR
jgi:ketosteroid isomerase-like protein